MGWHHRVAGRPRSLPWLVVAVLCATFAATVPQVASGQPVQFTPTPQVLDPLPVPGAVVQAGPVVIAARVTGAGDLPIRFLVDSQPVRGRRVDPDGHLTDLAGIEVNLSPGIHRVSVRVGEQAEVRSWEISAAGLDVVAAQESAVSLLSRLGLDPVEPSPVVLIAADGLESAVALPLLVNATGAGVIVVADDAVAAQDWPRLRQSQGPVILLGGVDRLPPGIEAALDTAGLAWVRIDGATTQAQVSTATNYLRGLRADATTSVALVVGPAHPFETALATVVAATQLNADLVLVGAQGPDPQAAEVIGQYGSVLMSTALSADARQAVIAAMAPGAVASDDALRPQSAREAIVIADTVERSRAIVAATAADPNRPVLVGSSVATAWIAANRPERITMVIPEPLSTPPVAASELFLPALATTPAVDGDAPAVRPRPTLVQDARRPIVGHTQALTDQLRRAWVDGPNAPAVEALIDQTSDAMSVTLSASDVVTGAQVHVSTLGYEWPGAVQIRGRQVIWTAAVRPALPLPLEPGGPDTPFPIQITTAITVRADRTSHRLFSTIVGLDPSDTVSPEGWIVAGGTDAVQLGQGRPYTYSVEIEPQTGLDIRAVQAEVTSILTDPRSWTGDGRVALRRVGSAQAAQLRVVVARPATVDAYCGQVGLRTGGRVSCWDGYRAMLNLNRWNTGVVPFHADVEVYRQYLVNHEVGHGLGHGHEFCPRFQALAPVMVQQTGGLGGCRTNGWPYP
ncbi:MAG: DUF3152 domain-containing protein [Euzebya sp.]